MRHKRDPLITIVTRNATGSGGLGRYERALLTALADADVRHVPVQPWPVPSPIVASARLARVDLTTILRGKRSYVPGPRTEGIYHLTNHELAVSETRAAYDYVTAYSRSRCPGLPSRGRHC